MIRPPARAQQSFFLATHCHEHERAAGRDVAAQERPRVRTHRILLEERQLLQTLIDEVVEAGRSQAGDVVRQLEDGSVPVLETERVILRAHRTGDFDAYAAMWADPEVTRFIGKRARTREESWLRFLRHAGCWSLVGYGFWAAEEQLFRQVVALAAVDREATSAIRGVARIACVPLLVACLAIGSSSAWTLAERARSLVGWLISIGVGAALGGFGRSMSLLGSMAGSMKSTQAREKLLA